MIIVCYLYFCLKFIYVINYYVLKFIFLRYFVNIVINICVRENYKVMCGNIIKVFSGVKYDSKEVNFYCKCCLDVLKWFNMS